MNATPIPDRLLRERFFFGLGMAILPPFWAWWTLGHRHTLRQQALAFLWANVYLLLILVFWRYTGDRILALTLSYGHLLITEAFWLGWWLLWRMFGLAMIIFTDVIAMMSSIEVPHYLRTVQQDPSAAFWIPLKYFVAMVLLHLLLEPAKKFLARVGRPIPPWFPF